MQAGISDHKPLHELYAPGPRKLHFPNADYRFLVRCAYNTARVAAAVHHSGCVIGDINHSGILISSKATVAFIDADSFQFTDGATKYLCKVGVDQYTPPELIGARLDATPRTANHDSFGLGIVLFQLLFMGRHPFMGTYAKGDLSPADAISQFRFAYSRQRQTEIKPPPGACRLEDFPNRLGNLFETAFGPTGPRLRPATQEWMDAIGELEKSLRPCSVSSLHHYSNAAKECPWCRMEKATQTRLFIDAKANLGAAPTWHSTFDEANFRAQLNALPVINTFNFNIVTPMTAPPKFATPSQATSKPNIRKMGWYVAAGGLALSVLADGTSPEASTAGLLIIAAGIVMVLFGGTSTPKDTEQQTNLRRLDIEYSNRLEILISDVDIDTAHLSNAKIHGLLADRQFLLKQKRDEESKFKKDHEENSIGEYLDKFLIASAKIDGISSLNVNALRSWGIETAGDIRRHNVRDVAGIGKVKGDALNIWSKKMSGRFQGSQGLSSIQQAELNRRLEGVNQKIRASEENLFRELGRLREICSKIISLRNIKDPYIEDMLKRRSKIVAEIRAIRGNTFAIPDLPQSPVRHLRQATIYEANRIKAGSIIQFFQRQNPVTPPPTPRPKTSGSQLTAPKCPKCNSVMTQRLASRGANMGKYFWGCTKFPRCSGTRPI